MALSREYRCVPVELYQRIRQAWLDVSFPVSGRLSAPRPKRTR
jgi:hypothetical protein